MRQRVVAYRITVDDKITPLYTRAISLNERMKNGISGLVQKVNSMTSPVSRLFSNVSKQESEISNKLNSIPTHTNSLISNSISSADKLAHKFSIIPSSMSTGLTSANSLINRIYSRIADSGKRITSLFSTIALRSSSAVSGVNRLVSRTGGISVILSKVRDVTQRLNSAFTVVASKSSSAFTTIVSKSHTAIGAISSLISKANVIPGIISKIRSTTDSIKPSFSKLHGFMESLHTRMMNIPKGIASGFGWLRNSLGDFGAFLAGQFAVSAVFAFFGKATNLAKDLNETMNKSQVVFGSFYKDIERYADKADKLSGFSKNQAMSYASSFGSMFKELGYSGKTLADLSEGAVRLSSDLASFHNLDPGQAFEALFSGIKGETEVLASNFGIVIDEMMIKKKAIDMGLVSKKNAGSALTKDMKVMAAYQLIIDKTKDAQGDFARTSDQAANKERILKASVENNMATFGKLLLPLYDKFLTLLLKVTTWIKKNSGEIKYWAVTIFKIVAPLAAVYALLTILTSMNPFAWIFIAIVGIIAFIRYWDIIKVHLIKWGAWVLKWAVKFTPQYWMAKFIKYLMAKLEELFPGITEKLIKIGQWILDWIVKLGKFLWEYSPFNLLLLGLDMIFPGLKEKFYSIVSWIMDEILKFIKWFKGSVVGQMISKAFDLKWDVNMKAPEDLKKKQKKKDEKPKEAPADTYDYAGLTKDLKDRDKPKGDLGGAVNDTVSGASVSGGGNIKNITISINKLIESFTVSTQNLGMSEPEIRKIVTRTLLTAVNDVNYG